MRRNAFGSARVEENWKDIIAASVIIACIITALLFIQGCSLLCPIFPSICEPTPIPTPSPVWSPTPPTPIPTLTPQATKTPGPVSTGTVPPTRTPTRPTPSPAVPSPTPAPAYPFGTVISIWPSVVPRSWGSIDFKDGSLWEHCRGQARIWKRDISTGEILEDMYLDSRLTGLWAVAWDRARGCWWATNPEETGINYNLIQLSKTGQILSGSLMMGGTSNNPIRIYDIEVNWNYTTTIQSDPIDAGTMLVADRHAFSGSQLIKVNFITVDTPGYWERFWWGVDISFRADARTGCTYWLACDFDNPVGGDYPIYEYRQALYRKERCDASSRTGRKIVVPGVWFSSIIATEDGAYMWGKGITAKTGESAIYKISLGHAPAPTPQPTATVSTPWPTPSPSGPDIPFSVIIPDSSAQSVAVDSAGNVYVTGSTGAGLVYVAKFSPSGQQLAYRTISTGNGQAIAIDNEGSVIIGGGVTDDNWPVKNAYQVKRLGVTPNCYLAKLDSSLSNLAWSTYIGGGLQHAADAPDGTSIKTVRTDSVGNVYYLASGQDMDAPVTRCIIGDPGGPGHYTVYERTHAWGYGGDSKWSNVFAGKFSPSGQMLSIVNVGGGGPDTTSGALAVSPAGDVFLGARTKSTQGGGMAPWPSTVGAFRGTPYNGGQAWFDGAAVKLNRPMSDLAYATFLGGHQQNNPFGGAERDGFYTQVGYTKAGDFPISHAIQGTFGGSQDWTVSKLDQAGSALEYSTFLGGPGLDVASEVVIDSQGRTWISGMGSTGFPTTDGSKIGSGTSSVVSRISGDGRTLEYSTSKHGGQDATYIVCTPGFYVVAITDGDDGKVVKARQP